MDVPSRTPLLGLLSGPRFGVHHSYPGRLPTYPPFEPSKSAPKKPEARKPEDSPSKRRAGDLSLPLSFHFPLIPLYQPLVPILLRSLSRSIFRLGLELFSPFSLGIDDLSRSITIDRPLMIRMIIINIIGDIVLVILDPFGSTPTSSFEAFLFPFSFFPGFFDGQCFSFFFQLSGSEETSFSFLYRWGGCSGSAGGFGWRFLEGGFRLS
jgi:hypothetical protein